MLVPRHTDALRHSKGLNKTTFLSRLRDLSHLPVLMASHADDLGHLYVLF